MMMATSRCHQAARGRPNRSTGPGTDPSPELGGGGLDGAPQAGGGPGAGLLAGEAWAGRRGGAVPRRGGSRFGGSGIGWRSVAVSGRCQITHNGPRSLLLVRATRRPAGSPLSRRSCHAGARQSMTLGHPLCRLAFVGGLGRRLQRPFTVLSRRTGPIVNIVDIVVLAVVALAAIRGLRLGAIVQVLSFGGLFIGLYLGALLASVTVDWVQSPSMRTVVALVTMLVAGALGGAAGRVVGSTVFAPSTGENWD